MSRGNKSESNIPLSYYEGIDDMHFSLFIDHLLPEKLVKLYVLSWGQYNDPKLVWENLSQIISGKKELPSLTKISSLPERLDESQNFVYHSVEEISRYYENIKFFRKEQELSKENSEMVNFRKKFSAVFIPSNMMTISAEEKNVVNNKNYGVIFYRNEFKRVVLWHLAHSQNVFFYTK